MTSTRKSRHGRGRGRSRKRRPAPGGAALETPPGGASGDGGAGRDSGAGGDRGDGGASSGTRTGNGARARARTRTGAGGRTAGAHTTGARTARASGERPPAPWHPLPLSELLILIGAVGAVVGLARLGHGGIANGGPVLFAGLGAVLIGTLEITWREHNAGYRSHALLLALLPVVVFHTAVVLVLAAVTTVSRLVNVGLLAVDAAIFTVLFKLLRVRFLDARARSLQRR